MNEFENDMTIPKEILELIFPNVDEVMNEYFEKGYENGED